MTAPEPPPRSADPAWAQAEEVADRHRAARLAPRSRRTNQDGILRPTVVTLWFAAVVLALIGLLTPGDRGYVFGFASYGALGLFTAVGGWWLVSSGRYILRGSSTSIRAAIPLAARRSVRRQLALREPLDREHADVVIELAHQGRHLIGGQIALYAFYVPLDVNIARNLHGWFGIVILAAGTAALVTGAILLAISNRRLALVMQSHAADMTPRSR